MEDQRQDKTHAVDKKQEHCGAIRQAGRQGELRKEADANCEKNGRKGGMGIEKMPLPAGGENNIKSRGQGRGRSHDVWHSFRQRPRTMLGRCKGGEARGKDETSDSQAGFKKSLQSDGNCGGGERASSCNSTTVEMRPVP